MHERFRLLALKLPLPKRSEAKGILLVQVLSPKSDPRGQFVRTFGQFTNYSGGKCPEVSTIFALNHAHWDKVSWESRSPSGVSACNVVNKSLATWLGVLVVWIWSDHRLPGELAATGVSASKPENCTRRLRALTLSSMSSLFEEHGVSHGPKT